MLSKGHIPGSARKTVERPAGLQQAVGLGARHRSLGAGHRRIAVQAAQNEVKDEFPKSQDDAVDQAVAALNASFQVGKKRKKKGMKLWPGVKRHSVEIPIADQSPEAQLAIARALLATFPPAAGLPIAVFGSQATTEAARSANVPFSVFSVGEAAAPAADDDDDDDLRGPLLLFDTSYDQAAACQRIVDELWSGRLVVVANAGWLRDEPPAVAAELADSLDAVYYFLPVSFSGMLGGGQEAFLFKWTQSEELTKWAFFLSERKGMRLVGEMAKKPSNEDLEAMVYNASAAKSPLTAGAKVFNKLTKGLRREK